MLEIFFFLWRNSPTRAGRLIIEVSRSPTIRHTHTHTYTHRVGLPWKSDQLVADTASDTTHKMCKRGTSVASAGFEPAIPLIVAAAHLRLRPHGLQDRPLKNYCTVKLNIDYEILRVTT